MHKRSSMSHIYSHCVVIHFAAHSPSNLWPQGIAACSHAEWVGSCALAARKADRWRKEPDVEAVDSLRRASVMPSPKLRLRKAMTLQKGEINGTPSWAHSARGMLWRLSRELP